MSPTAVDVIAHKRDRQALTDEEIRWFLAGYTAGEVADEQCAALLMAVYLNGFDQRELDTWTEAMIASGTRLDLSGVRRPTVDKHSTGGVGDKVSLILCPLVAACGAAVPQLSGRGLGHTGGTLDKMESIPGWSPRLSAQQMVTVLDDVGAVIAAAGDDLAPADRKLYALRDVTATVSCIPLIASSIMSKKIAEGTSALVLDVKIGSGAFLPEIERARELAATMVRLGEGHGVRTRALITRMDEPLGRTAGNALEVDEAVEVLRGGGPADLVDLTVALAAEMCDLAGVEADPSEVLASGAAEPVWEAMVRAQGGDPAATLASAPHVEVVEAPASGVLQRLDALAVGTAAWLLGAGRARKEDPVSAAAGVVIAAKPGERVVAGEPLLWLHADDPSRFGDARNALSGSVEVADRPFDPGPVVVERIA
jgi:thymidine phosphorylase